MQTEETTSIATVRRTSENLAVAAGYSADDLRGKEGISAEEMRLPYLAIAQKTSKAIDPTEGKYIDGLKFLDMYNSETREAYGSGPLQFIPVLLRKRAALKNEDGTLGETVDWNDPRVIPPWKPGSKVTNVDDLEGVRILDWAVILTATGERLVVSFMSKSFPAGESLCTFVNTRRGPAFAGLYEIKVVGDKNSFGSFGKFGVKPAGKPSEADAADAEEFYMSIKDKKIVTSDEDVVEGATAGEGENAAAGGEAGKTADVPF